MGPMVTRTGVSGAAVIVYLRSSLAEASHFPSGLRLGPRIGPFWP
jgi:hypothetical protein